MAWMLRWWQAILSALQGGDRELRGWVEPSNAITRAILASPPAAARAAPPPVETAAEPLAPAAEAPSEPEAAPAVRTRRRRSSRAA